MVFLSLLRRQISLEEAKKAGIEHVLKYLECDSAKTRRPREPAPGWKKHYHSYVFGRKMRVRVTNSAKRTIADAGGFDRYIYYTPEEDFKSKLGVVLQRRMRFLVERHPNVAPPPLDKRNPKPVSKKISAGLPPVEVANMSKYLFLA